MMDRQKVFVSSFALALAFATGRYTNTKPSISLSEKTTVQRDTVKNTQTHKTVVTTKAPDGTIKTVATIDTNTEAENKTQDVSSTKLEQKSAPKLNVSALAGVETTKSFAPVYGLSVSKEILGPVIVGLFGMTNGTVGVSLGLEF